MANTIGKTESLWTPKYILLLVISLFNGMGSLMINPTLPKYAISLGVGLTAVGAISGAFAITALATRPFCGLLVDRFNKKTILIMSALFITFAAFGYSFSKSIGMLVFFRIIHGAAYGINMTANTSLVSDNIPRARLAEGISLMAIGLLVAYALAPNLGLYIGSTFGYNYSFLIAASFSLVAMLLMFLLKIDKPDIPKEKKVRQKIRINNMIAKEVLIFSAIAAILSVASNIETTFLPLYADSKGIKNIGLYYTVTAIAVILIRIFGGKISDKKGLTYVLYPSLAICAVAMFITGNANALWVLLIAACIKSVGQGFIFPALQATSIKKLDSSRSGVATSTFYLGNDVGQGLGPVVSGAIASSFGYRDMFFFCSGLFVLGIIIFYIYSIRSKKTTLKV